MNELDQSNSEVYESHIRGQKINQGGAEIAWLVLTTFKEKIYSRLPEGYSYSLDYFNHELKRQFNERNIMRTINKEKPAWL